MIRFLFKGLWRDKSRSRLPIIVVATGVMLSVWLHAYITGFMGETIEMNARFNYGHVKVMTQAYAKEMDLIPNDLAIIGANTVLTRLQERYPDMAWSERIRFGGLIDAPDENGETKAQGPAFGWGLDLLSENPADPQRMNLSSSIVRGRMPEVKGEVLISDAFARKLEVHPDDHITLIGSTMEGSLAMHNFIVAGTLSFGVDLMDRGTVIADIADVRQALQMDDATGEIVGFFEDGFYDNEKALAIAAGYNALHDGGNDEYAPVMLALSDQQGMGIYVEMGRIWSGYITLVFVFAMSLVLWNAGLLGGLRRYGEFGIRLAMGESKGQVYRSLIYESVLIGTAGSVIGTIIGLFFAWLIQKYGIDISGMMEGASVMFPTKIRARITPPDFYIGFVPGLFSTVLGTMLSGIGIYKRQTSRLINELV
jgi:putative ABC transport system permease protein